ncbi:hypothetical protein HK105_206029 [Polyrhizophydium stewartii]|uniref:Uncharacterized protein n=1 Tax=Polyrhizophydium stewartii TaxID=2732419 RepID=A0ABR4N4L1_9FUNG
MSTFPSSKRSAFAPAAEETPAPNAYAPESGLVNNDKNKHFGFIEKSKRFRPPAKDYSPMTFDGNPTQDQEPRPESRSPSPPPPPSKHTKTEMDEIKRLRSRVERYNELIERTGHQHSRDLTLLHERIVKLEAQLQLAIQEKQKAETTCLLREKTILELTERQASLASSLEKSEKSVQVLQERANRYTQLKRKIEDKERTDLRVRTHYERIYEGDIKLAVEENARLKSELETSLTDKAAAETAATALKAEQRSLRKTITDLTTDLNAHKEKYETAHARWSSERAELEARSAALAEKLDAQKREFAESIRTLSDRANFAEEEQRKEMRSHEQQRAAFIDRITQLEADLEITERSVREKHQEMERMASSMRKMHDSFKAQLEQVSLDAERRFAEAAAHHEAELREARDEHEQRVSRLESTLQESFTKLKEERQRYDSSVHSLKGRLQRAENEHKELLRKHEADIDSRKKLLEAKDAEIEQIRQFVQAKQEESDHAHETVEDLSQRLQQLMGDAEQQRHDAEARLREMRAQLAESTRKIERLQGDLADRERLAKQEISRANTSLANAVKEASRFQQQLVEKTREMDNQQSLFSQHQTTLNRRVEEAEREARLLSNNYAELLRQYDEVKEASGRQIEELQSSLQAQTDIVAHKEIEFGKQAQNLEKRISDLSRQLEMTTTQSQLTIADLRQRLGDSETARQSLEPKAKELEAQRDQLERLRAEEAADAMRKIRELSNQHQLDTKAIAELEQDLREANQEKDSSVQALREAQSRFEQELAHAQDDLTSARAESRREAEARRKAEAEKQKLSKELQSLKKSSSASSTQLAELKEQLELQEEQIRDLNEQIANINEECTTSMNVCDQLESDKATLSKELAKTKADSQVACSKLTAENQRLSLELAGLQSKYNEERLAAQQQAECAEAEAQSAREDFDRLSEDLLDSKKDLERAEDARQQLVAQVNKLREQVATLEESLLARERDTSDAAKSLERQLKERDATIQSHKQEFTELTAKLVQAQADLQSVNYRHAAAQDELQKAMSQIEVSREEKDALIASLEGMREHLDRAVRERDELQGKLEDSRRTYRTVIDEKNALEATLSAAQREITQHTSDLTRLHHKINRLEEEAKYTESTTATQVSQLAELRRLFDAERGTRSQKERAAKDLTDKLAEAEAKVRKLEGESTQAQQVFEKHMKELVDEYHAETAKRQAELDGMRRDLDTARRDLDMRTRDVQRVRDERQELEKMFAGLKDHVTKLAGSLETAERDLSLATRRCTVAENDLAEYRRSADSQIHSLKADVDSLRGNLQRSRSESERLEQDVATAERARRSLEAQVAELQQELSSRQIELAAERTEAEAAKTRLEADIKDVEAQLREARHEIRSLQQDKQHVDGAARREIEELRAKIDQLTKLNASQKEMFEAVSGERSRLERDMLMAKAETESEMTKLRATAAQIEKRLKQESEHFEQAMKDSSEKVALKSATIRQLERELTTVKDEVNRTHLRHTNETCRLELEIKTLRKELHESHVQCDDLQAKISELSSRATVSEESMHAVEAEAAARRDLEARMSESEAMWDEERRRLVTKVDNLLTRLRQMEERCGDLEVMVEEADTTKREMQASFDESLKMLELRGKLNQSEAKKIAELNAELFGHANSKQKIRHLSQLKEENLQLKSQNKTLNRERESLRQQLAEMKRELSSLRPLEGSKRMSAARRHALGATQIQQIQQMRMMPTLPGSYAATPAPKLPDARMPAGADDDAAPQAGDRSVLATLDEKENRRTGGVTFTISP